MYTVVRVAVGLKVLAIAAVYAAISASAQAPAKTPQVVYEEQIQPIFDKNCAGCHTSGGHSGGLRLDNFRTMMAGSENGAVVLGGNPDGSPLVRAIRYKDEMLQMPPKGKLPDSDIATIERWIKESGKDLTLSLSTLPTDTAAASRPAEVAAPATATASAAAIMSANPDKAALQIAATHPTAEQERFFEEKVRPILVNKCYSCHGSAARGGLRLDSRAALMKGGRDGAVVVPGDPEHSLLITAVHYADPKLQMPPRGPLKSEQIADLVEWVRMGAPWPEETNGAATRTVPASRRDFWAFQKPVRPQVPAVNATYTGWVETDIDRFIVAKYVEKKLKPVSDADKRTMIRRVTYDLTGLPPTSAEVEAYLHDKSPKAWEHLVDRLLASPAYGERWGRMWLDVVRYSDTTGGGGDFPIPQMAKYRDYVIKSFNEDKPYDRFIREQIAGDLLPAKSEAEHWQSIVATGYIANANHDDRAWISDAVDNIGSAYLGLTVGCARCHDHKFDPIPTRDYYAMYGILQSATWPQPGDDGTRMQQGFPVRYEAQAEADDVRIFRSKVATVQNAINAVLRLPGTYDDLLPQLEARRMNLYAHAPKLPEDAYAMTEGTPKSAQIQQHGDPQDLGAEVPRGFLQVLGGQTTLPANTKGSGRLELANWIASADNPLTARVIVNRIWQGHFGRGIVATPNDFGTRGAPPSNQALLDYLAYQLIDKGWSIKAIHREILLSHAYRLASADSSANDEIDAENDFIWRHTRTRLDAEEIRDTMLADAGLLDRTPAGMHPFPPQSQWNYEEQAPFIADLSKYEDDHRSVYMMVQRRVRNPYYLLFDGADPHTSTDKRGTSLTPLQALYFMNSAFPGRCASALVKQAPPESETEFIRKTYMSVYGRAPRADELTQIKKMLTQSAAIYEAHGQKKEEALAHAKSHFVRALFSTNEFMFVD